MVSSILSPLRVSQGVASLPVFEVTPDGLSRTKSWEISICPITYVYTIELKEPSLNSKAHSTIWSPYSIRIFGFSDATPLEQWVKHGRFGTHPDASWAGHYTESMDRLYTILYPVTVDAFRSHEVHPVHGMVYSTYLLLKLPGEQVELTEAMLSFKGQEVWGDTLSYRPNYTKQVSWTGKDFQRHTGSRVTAEPGLTIYRRVYHEQGMHDLQGIDGELIYSPQEGMTLPTVIIKERAWI